MLNKLITSQTAALKAVVSSVLSLVFALSLVAPPSTRADEPLWVFEDPTGELTYTEVMANAALFAPSDDTSRGMTDSVFWIRVDLSNSSNRAETQFVKFDSIAIPEVTEYVQQATGMQVRSNGYAVPFDQRPTSGISIVFPHELAAGSERQLFYRIASEYKVDLGFSVVDEGHFESEIFRATASSIMVGGFLMLLLYNLFLAITVRSKLYFIYSTFLASALTITIGFSRFYEYFGLLIDPLWLDAQAGILIYSTAFWFLSNLFEKEQKPIIKHIGRFYYLLVFAHVFTDPGQRFFVYAFFTGPIIFSILTYTLAMAVIAGNQIARFVAFGWLIYIGFSLMFLGNLVGLLDAKYELFLAYGNLIEALIGSSVLTYRMRNVVRTEQQLKQVSFELERERLSSEIGFGYKWEIDVKKRLIRPDETFARWHGSGWQAGQWYPLGEFYANIPQIYHTGLKEQLAVVLESAKSNSEASFDALSQVVRADTGAQIWVRHQGTVLTVNGRALLVGISLDTSELINVQDELRRNLERQKEMFAIIGHELRTPVSTIRMVLEDESSSSQSKVNQIKDIVQNLLSVLDDMRIVVNPQRAMEYKPVVTNPVSVVKRALTTLSHLVSERNMTLYSRLNESSNSSYLVHEQALRQILTNLVKNAANHSAGSQINVELKIIDTEQGAEAVLTVEDDGKGIPPERVELLYQAFTRGDTNRDGSGLGLFIVQELARRLDGAVDYSQSKLGGACFTLKFPLRQSMLDSEKPKSAEEQFSLEGLRILFAEDDRTLRMLTERVLSGKGAQVTSRENGKMALEAFELDEFDLVITDLMMPEMDGHELTREIRALGATTPIIAMTAAVIGEETDRFITEGADAVLAKPFQIDQLISELAKRHKVI